MFINDFLRLRKLPFLMAGCSGSIGNTCIRLNSDWLTWQVLFNIMIDCLGVSKASAVHPHICTNCIVSFEVLAVSI